MLAVSPAATPIDEASTNEAVTDAATPTDEASTNKAVTDEADAATPTDGRSRWRSTAFLLLESLLAMSLSDPSFGRPAIAKGTNYIEMRLTDTTLMKSPRLSAITVCGLR